jgi:hypothetical protein
VPDILLGYFEESRRKKDKRKMILRHSILRIKDKEYILPNVKGEFLWIGSKNAQVQ